MSKDYTLFTFRVPNEDVKRFLSWTDGVLTKRDISTLIFNFRRNIEHNRTLTPEDKELSPNEIKVRLTKIQKAWLKLQLAQLILTENRDLLQKEEHNLFLNFSKKSEKIRRRIWMTTNNIFRRSEMQDRVLEELKLKKEDRKAPYTYNDTEKTLKESVEKLKAKIEKLKKKSG